MRDQSIHCMVLRSRAFGLCAELVMLAHKAVAVYLIKIKIGCWGPTQIVVAGHATHRTQSPRNMILLVLGEVRCQQGQVGQMPPLHADKPNSTKSLRVTSSDRTR